MGEPRVVIVTGAGGGLGQALVAEFRQQAWRVAAGYRAEAPNTDQPDFLPLNMDVTNGESVRAAVEKVLSPWQRVDVLVNNAGVADDAALSQMDHEAWERVLAVNLKGVFLCAQAVSRAMIKQRDGHIINVSSFSGRAGQRGQANYAAAKAGQFGLTTALAHELGSRNVRVNAVLPGVLPTKMTSSRSPDEMQQFAEANALDRINSVEEVARFIVFLAGTRNISGQLFQLDSRIAPWA
jgi:3-oxoacyl-[acyl-carrier protein] reductase